MVDVCKMIILCLFGAVHLWAPQPRAGWKRSRASLFIKAHHFFGPSSATTLESLERQSGTSLSEARKIIM
eukprot:scaffold3341_cov270-Chaetoceros_neogracile.AAC.24